MGILLGDCSAVSSEDVAKLKVMGDAFLHPKQLIIDAEHNVILNGVQILKDVKAAGSFVTAGAYEQAGEEYGTVAALVLWGSQNNLGDIFLQ